MKKIIVMMMAAMLMAAPVSAQTETEGISNTVSELWTQAKKKVKKSSRLVKEEWDGEGLLEIEGHKYMYLYTNDLYRGEQAEEFKKCCRKEFEEKYPAVKILSVAIPQTEWTESTTRSLGRVSKYLKTLYCYILAQDGEDGYINARFSFQQVKKVGKSWNNDEANWPLWERTDVLVPSVYKKLKEKE